MPPPAFLAGIKAIRKNVSPPSSPSPKKVGTKSKTKSKEANARLEKYKKMKTMGVPEGAIKQKMRANGLDPASLFPNGSPKAAAAPAAVHAAAPVATRKASPKKAAAVAIPNQSANKISNNSLIAELQKVQKARKDPEYRKKLEEERAAKAAVRAANVTQRNPLSKKGSALKKELAALERKAGFAEKRGANKEIGTLQVQYDLAEVKFTREALTARLKGASKEEKEEINRKLVVTKIHQDSLETRLKLAKAEDELAAVEVALEVNPNDADKLKRKRDLTKEIPKLEATVSEAEKRVEAAKAKFGLSKIPKISHEEVRGPKSSDCVSRNIMGRCLKTRKQRSAERKKAPSKPAASNNWWGW